MNKIVKEIVKIHMFKDWSKFELVLLFVGILMSALSGTICKSSILTTMCAITVIVCALTQAKGKVISQFVGLVAVVLYSLVSYQNRYFGEVIIYVFIMLPLFVAGIISWIKNVNKETNTVNEYNVSKKEWCILAIISTIAFIVLYFILKYFNTSQLFISTLSMVTSLYATYLVARRSKYGFLFYIGNDIILFLLWGIPVALGKLAFIPMLITPIINFVNDTYAWRCWNKKG